MNGIPSRTAPDDEAHNHSAQVLDFLLANTVASQAMYLFESPKLRLTAIYCASL